MTQRIPIAFLFIFLACAATAQPVQDWTAYMKLIKKADTLYQKGLYSEAVRSYTAAFTFNHRHYSEGDNYNAARAWAMSGQSDSAVAALRLELEMGFHNVINLKREKAFKKLHGTRNWKDLVNKAKANRQAENLKLGKYKKIKPRLEAILIDDQKYRKDYRDILTQRGAGSAEMKELLVNMQRLDKKNIEYVSGVLDKYGWIDYHIIGYDAGAALFLVVQHSDSSMQEKYLPLLEKAVLNKMAFGSDLALLEDRVLIRRGQKQKYGSQVECDSTGMSCYVLPIEDERNVDKRRAERGMQPLANYLKHWNINYYNKEDAQLIEQQIWPGSKFAPDLSLRALFPGQFEEKFILTRDQVKLHGLLFKSGPSKGLVFYLHGSNGGVDVWGKIAPTYTDLGYDFFVLDYRGYGKSEGKITSEPQLFNDIQDAYDYMIKSYPEDRIVIIGQSIGTGPAAWLAANNHPQKLILQAPYYSLTDWIQQLVPDIDTSSIRYKLNTFQYIQQTKVPIIIFHGDADEAVYYGSSVKLKVFFKQGDELITLAGEGHNDFTKNKDYLRALMLILK